MFKQKTEAVAIGTKFQQVKSHLQENRNTYLAGAGGLLVGALIFRGTPIRIVNTASPIIAPVFNNTVNNGGHMRKIVRCLETGEMWSSVTDAAISVGATLPKMSQHLNGHKAHVNGLHYVIEGLAAG